MKAELKPVTTQTVVLTLTEDEARLVMDGIGKTSDNSRREAGMTSKQANAVAEVYFTLAELLRGLKCD